MAQLDGTAPIEVVLTRKNLAVSCLVSHEDESTQWLTVDSLSMRGAQREVTGYLIGKGYEPAGRWSEELAELRASGGGGYGETTRQFRPRRTPDDASNHARA